jgi:hypothetical protein
MIKLENPPLQKDFQWEIPNKTSSKTKKKTERRRPEGYIEGPRSRGTATNRESKK